ncbi:MAG TPA: hypothetical protein VJU61_08300 [Polyangiaceae bacterium]|nr:hypothetical protein [Polyangiaceae bacterium]
MLTKKFQSIGVLVGLGLVPSLAGAADGAVPAIPGEPPSGTPPALPTGPVPAPEPAPTAPPTDTWRPEEGVRRGEPAKLLNVDVEASSAYVWRGINVFGDEQNSQAFSVFPSLTATFGGLSLGYWGAFQLSGDNKSALVDAGVGAENDFVLKYTGSLDNGLALSAMLTYWIYPFADEEVAGTSTPMYLEPGVGLSYLAGADLGLYLGYYRGLQDVTQPASFVYINPSIGKTVGITEDLGLALGLSAGYKIFTEDPPAKDRAFDLALHLSMAIPFSDMYITPGLHAAYATRDEAVVPDAEFSDSFVAWAGVHVGYDVGL